MPSDSFCKICAHPEAPRFIKGAREGGKSGKGWNSAEAIEAGAVFGLKFTRQTWYAHVAHLDTAENRVIAAATKAARANLVPTRTTNMQFLETIRDMGMARALADPDSISIDQALKATQILEAKKEKGQDSLAILVQFVVGAPPPVQIEGPVYEGVAREITEGNT